MTGQLHRRPGRTSVLPAPSPRMVLVTGLAGGAALLPGLGHSTWVACSAAAVLHSINVRFWSGSSVPDDAALRLRALPLRWRARW